MTIATKKKGSRQRLAEERLKTILKTALDGFWLTNLEGKLLEVNDSYCKMVGYKREELLNMYISDLEAVESHEGVAQHIKRIIEQGYDRFESRHKRKDGKIIDVEISVNYLDVGEGQLFVFARDITERKQVEEALRESQEFVNTVLEKAPYAVVVFNPDASIKYVNPAWEELNGWTLEEVVGLKPPHPWWPEELREEFGAAFKEAMAQDSGEGEIIAQKKNRERYWIALKWTSIKRDGKLLYLVTNSTDITERKKADAALRESQKFSNSLLENSPNPILVINSDTSVRYVNPAFEKLTGFTLAEITGRKAPYPWWPEEYREEMKTTFRNAMATGGRKTERNFQKKNGEPFWAAVNSAPVVHEGKPNYFILNWVDITERKQAEQALADEAIRRHILVDQSRDGIVVLDQNGKVYEANRQFAEMLGYSGEEVRQLSVFDWEYLYPHEQVLEMIRTVDEAGDHFETRHRRKDGSTIDVEISTNGAVVAGQKLIFCVCRDITRRKKMEQQLQEKNEQLDAQNEELKAINEELRATEEELLEAKEKFKNLVEATSDIIWEADETGTFTLVSPSIKDILGYEVNEVVGKRTLELTPKEEARKWLKHFKEITIKKVPFFGFEITHLHKNGNHLVFETSGVPFFDNAGNFKGFVGINKDITERKRAEQQLQEKNEQLDAQNEELKAINEELRATEEELQHSQERLERMFESVTDGIIVAALDGTILKVNQSAVQMHGFATDDEILGKNANDLVAPADRERISREMIKAQEKGATRYQECNLLKADGSEFPTELSTSALKNASGRVIGRITISRDITERKQAEEKERQLQQELNLASRLASIGQLAAGVAHEINNPLTGVIGFSHLMLSRDIPDDIKQDLQVINSEARRVAKIVENLLVFAHQRKTGREYVNINETVTRVLELRAYEMKVNNIEVETQLDPELPLTMADAGQLQQVFLNIVLNAEHFMARANNRGRLAVKTEKINGSIRASFTDNGTGISPENLDKIFNPFFTTKEVGKGTGLGLSICHSIITQHQGRIYAQSKPGKGATFVLELPIVAQTAPPGKAEETKKEPQKPRGAKIMVVDDEKAILTFLSRLLTEWGHSVETVNDASTALERLKTERYSLILLDIKLPGMSGIELYRHIEETVPALTRRVMFITGDVMEATTREFLEKAKVAHITKPLDIEMLKKMINRALNQTQAVPGASG